ncbi:MAG TPA: hypothetical protein VKH20_02460 [Solirubrobacterales bacterium]|nr:hypothetical protein [Solirubrobacterales bacterium]
MGRQRRLWARSLYSIAAGATLLVLAVAASAGAATWTARQLPAVGQAPLFAISCPSVSMCVAVGAGNTVASSVNPSAGAAAWSVVNPGGAGPPNQNEIKGISCPSTRLCVAASFEGLLLTSTDPTGGAASWSIADLNSSGPSTHFYGVSCPSPSFCAAAAGGGKVATSTNPTGGASAWTVTQLPGPLELRGISCPSPAFCVAVGDDGDNIRPEPTDAGEVLSSTNPLAGAWQQVQLPGIPGNLFGISCPSPALCVSGNVLGSLIVSTDPTGPASAWPASRGGGSVQLTAATCPSLSRCVAVDNNADVLTSTDPAGGSGAWTFTNLIPYTQIEGTRASNAMWGVSCPSISFCAIAAGDGQVFTSEDPFAETVEKQASKNRKIRRKGPKRPRTILAKRPSPMIELDRRKLTILFRFFAANHASVRGFTCRIDGRPLKRCRSPKAYRVGLGRHHFRVRAIGWSGLKGPVTTAAFRVCRPLSPPPPTPLPPCWHGPLPGRRGG